MTAIEIPSSVETIGERIFRRCTGLVNVTFEKGSRLTSITGDCVKDSGNRVTSYGAFLECTSLTKIEIPASVTTIGSGAFLNYIYINCSKYFSLKPVSGNLNTFCLPSFVV